MGADLLRSRLLTRPCVVNPLAVLLLSSGLLLGCSADGPTQTVAGRLYASPLLARVSAGELLVLAQKEGRISALVPGSGHRKWSLQLDAPADQEIVLYATPVVVGTRLVVVYQTVKQDGGERTGHFAVVVDLEAGELDPDFPTLELHAEVPAAEGSEPVRFNPPTSLSRAALSHAKSATATLGNVYVSFGNLSDIQPWHGWVFELDLDAWQRGGSAAAISAVLLTTPETHCPVHGASGSNEMICGGGVWAPSGPPIFSTEEGYELLVPTGNGQLDLDRRDYANALMRVQAGLAFEPECDATLCEGFEQRAPSPACLASCRNLFVPRLLPGDAPLRPASGICDGLTLMECYALIDYDFGANSPVKLDLAQGPSVYLQPGKDGYLYLIDADHMGTLYDREKLVDVCGAAGDSCERNQWRGMVVTQPTLSEVDGVPVVMVPTFMFDRTHPAGVVALKIVLEDGVPRFEPFWQAPDFADPEATLRFRFYSSRIVLSSDGDESYAHIVDVVDKLWGRSWWERFQDWRAGRQRGTILTIRVRDGKIVSRVQLAGRGQRFVLPLLHDGLLYVPSNSSLEIYPLDRLRP